MDPLIEGYIQETFHPDLCDTIRKAFELFELFSYPDPENDFINLLMVEDSDMPQAIQDHFTTILHKQVDYILHAHLVKTNEHTYLHEKVGIIEGLYNVQHLNDYSTISTVLESSLDPEEKFSEIISQCSPLHPMGILNTLNSVDESFMTTLKAYVHSKEEESGKLLTSFTELQKRIIENMRLFKLYLGEKKALGFMMVDANILIGQPIERYVSFVEDALKNDDYDQLAKDIYSLIILTDEGYNSPLQCYRKHTGLLLDDLHSVTRIDTLLVGIDGDFAKFKTTLTMKASNEQN